MKSVRNISIKKVISIDMRAFNLNIYFCVHVCVWCSRGWGGEGLGQPIKLRAAGRPILGLSCHQKACVCSACRCRNSCEFNGFEILVAYFRGELPTKSR